jgi:predicted MFS family arabinose efflux permease
MDQLIVREIINGSIAVLLIAIAGVFLWNLSNEARPSNKGWYRNTTNQGIVALSTFFLFELLYRLWVFAVLWEFKVDTGRFSPQANYWFAIMCGIGMLFGGLCTIRVFSRKWVGHWLWIFVAAIVITVAVIITAANKVL